MAGIVQYIFVITTGLTLHISYQKHLSEGKIKTIKRRFYHAAKLFFWAVLITLVTWILYDAQAVKFGILHFYTAAILLGLFFVNMRITPLILGLGIILFTPTVINLTTDAAFLFPIGITQLGFQSLDYFPLFPWFGWFLLGISLGAFFYPRAEPKIKLNFLANTAFTKPFRYLGKHSLLIYLLHQSAIASLILLYKQII